MQRFAASFAGLLLLTCPALASADEWAVYESDAGANDTEEPDEDVELEDLGVGGSTGPSTGPAKGPSSGPSKGACNCDVRGGPAPTGLAGLGFLLAASLLLRGRPGSRRAQRGGRA
jgi:hypothetical protein